MNRDSRYVVAARRPWNRRIFEECIATLPGRWHFIDDPNRQSSARLQAIRPRYVFFLHWSWKVPAWLLERYECVGFHMTDLPYGRGGSPLQHLILRGRRQTTLTALRLTGSLDAGPVYLKRPLSLAGSAEQIYARASRLAARMIRTIVARRPAPVPQRGRAVVFGRRRPEQSRIAGQQGLERLHDFIRMLDAEGYPRAFLEAGGFRFEFSRAARRDGRLQARVAITPVSEP